jgi:hypothetical protein
MTVRDRVYSAFKESFDLDDETNTSKLVYQAYPAWTSVKAWICWKLGAGLTGPGA